MDASLKARQIMQPNIITVHQASALKEIATHMVIGRISGFPVVDDDGGVVGVITELDLVRAVQQRLDLEATIAEDFMTRSLIYVDADTPVLDVMKVLDDHRIIRVPVLDNGELVGIVSRGDILRGVLRIDAATGAA